MAAASGGGGGSSSGGFAGSGGFGGGGGGGSRSGGHGGFGGGGGGGDSRGHGGFGAGDGGSSGGGGGGGLGAGGDVFVQQGGTLLIEGGALTAGTVNGGAGGASGLVGSHGGGRYGDGLGNGLFIQGNQWVTLAPQAAETLTVSGAIQDQSGSGGAGGLIIQGSGIVVLAADNSFTGGTTIDAGATLDLAVTGAGGAGGITFDTGSMLQIGAGFAVGNTIYGFAAGDLFDFRGIGPASSTTATIDNANTLVVSNGSLTQYLTLDPAQSYGSAWAVVDDGAGGSVVACYVRGTRIAVPGGERAIENLRIGDAVLTAAGEKRVRWIGAAQLYRGAHRGAPRGAADPHPPRRDRRRSAEARRCASHPTRAADRWCAGAGAPPGERRVDRADAEPRRSHISTSSWRTTR